MRFRVSLLRVNEAREQNRVPDEEDRRVVAHQVPNAVLGVELQSETAWVAKGVSGTAFARFERKSFC